MLRNYRPKFDSDVRGRFEDRIVARLARMMLLADLEGAEMGIARFEREALGLIRADGVTGAAILLIFWVVVDQAPTFAALTFDPGFIQGALTLSLIAKIILVLMLLGRARDLATEIFAPQSALALRRSEIMKNLEDRRVRGTGEGNDPDEASATS